MRYFSSRQTKWWLLPHFRVKAASVNTKIDHDHSLTQTVIEVYSIDFLDPLVEKINFFYSKVFENVRTFGGRGLENRAKACRGGGGYQKCPENCVRTI